ncbi:MAG: RIP metalloprotease RseP [Rickettsiales bacterium]|jgi:regulator of sigma E protease|nr:RIP metalloprotease RseP [Rickettsiales bacterium]
MTSILTFLYNAFAFIFVISLLVFVHEFGHYIACVWCKVRVASFSIGMGKEVFGWNNKRGERWKISMLPIGGYVMMYGDADASSGTADKKLLKTVTEEEKKTIIYFQPAWKKLIITAMGPIFNLVFAILLFASMYMTDGISITKPIISDILSESAAFNVLQKNDEIIEINGEKIDTFNQIQAIVGIGNGEVLNIKFLRNGAKQNVTIIPTKKITKDMFGNDIEGYFIGITSTNTESKRLNFFQSMGQGIKTTYKISKNTLVVLGQMIAGKRGGDGLGGPLKIAQYSAQSFNGGIILVIYFLGMLSANLGLMNLLPIPVLDGGQIFFLLIEMIVRRPIPEKIQERLLQAGICILLTVMIFATFNDVKGFFK